MDLHKLEQVLNVLGCLAVALILNDHFWERHYQRQKHKPARRRHVRNRSRAIRQSLEITHPEA